MNLSKNFTLEELIASETAARRGIDNTPSKEVIKNLEKLAVKLEEVRTILGDHPIFITSGYRSKDLNFVIKGRSNSQHMLGLACDFLCPAFGSPYYVCKALELRRTFMFDELIHEFGQWTHIGVNGSRREVLTICGPKLGYRRGIFKCGVPLDEPDHSIS